MMIYGTDAIHPQYGYGKNFGFNGLSLLNVKAIVSDVVGLRADDARVGG